VFDFYVGLFSLAKAKEKAIPPKIIDKNLKYKIFKLTFEIQKF
jgi:hypothetical protein